MHDMIQIRCRCCELPQRVRDQPGEPAKICSACLEHCGADEVSVRRRAESHLEMALERLEAARRAADDVYRDRDRYKEKVHAAYGGREIAIRKLRALAENHEQMGKGVCSCRTRGRASMAILDQSWVRSMIQRLASAFHGGGVPQT